MTSAFAVELAAAGAGVVDQLRQQHGPDGRGRCRSCRKDGFAPAYPCALAAVAEAAARVLAGERAP